MQYDVGQHGVAAAGEEGRQQAAQHGTEGLWATWRGGGQGGELSSLKRNRIFGGGGGKAWQGRARQGGGEANDGRDRCHSRFADRGGTSDCMTLKLPGAADAAPLVEGSGGEEGM